MPIGLCGSEEKTVQGSTIEIQGQGKTNQFPLATVGGGDRKSVSQSVRTDINWRKL